MKQAKSTQKFHISRLMGWGTFVIVLCSLMISFIQNQVEIASKRQELEAVQAQLEAQIAENTELQRVLESGTEEEIIERIARDNLGYAKPGERVFVDTSGI